jgi:hypothetical protein
MLRFRTSSERKGEETDHYLVLVHDGQEVELDDEEEDP